MKVSKTENRFKTGFRQSKTRFQKNPVLTSLDKMDEETTLGRPRLLDHNINEDITSLGPILMGAMDLTNERGQW